MDVPACQPRRLDDDLSPDISPGFRRCSYAGVITTSRKSLLVPIGSPKPKRHQHGKDRFVNTNPSATPFATRILHCPEREMENPEESLAAASSSSNHSRDSTSSSHSSSTMPPVLPKRRSSLLELHHRKSKSHSELMDLVEPYVSFAPVVHVTTIPAASEYPDDIRRDLWNTRRELKRFLRLAKSEKRQRQQQALELSDEEAERTECATPSRRTRRNGTRRNKETGDQEQEQQDDEEIDMNEELHFNGDRFSVDNDIRGMDDVLDRLNRIQ